VGDASGKACSRVADRKAEPYKGDGVRIGNVILNALSALLVAAGVALIGTFFLGPAFMQPEPGGKGSVTEKFNVPVLRENTVIADEGPEETKGKQEKEAPPVVGPKDKTLKLTIPAMSRVRDTEIPYTTGTDEKALRDHTAIHLEGTGHPWQEGANVYIAGHRLGYPSTGSFLAFYDLNVLKPGDAVYVKDANGKQYEYRVYRSMAVDPTDIFITEPVRGKSVLTLQTCTLPDYSQRLIVQAQRVA
jgi:sortase A